MATEKGRYPDDERRYPGNGGKSVVTTTFRVKKETTPECEIKNPEVKPGEVKPGGLAAIYFEACNKTSDGVVGPMLTTHVDITFAGPTRLPQLKQPISVKPGACVKYKTGFPIPADIRGGTYKVTLRCLGIIKAVASTTVRGR